MTGTGISSVAKLFTTVRRQFTDFFVLHAVFTALGFVVFTPIVGALGQLIIKFSAKEVLADTDILFFILSPYGMAAMLIFTALLITIIVFEISSMMYLYAAVSHGRPGGMLHALRFTGARSAKIFQFSLLLIVRLVLIVLPFLAVAGMVALLCLTDYDINYYLSAKPPVFWIAGSVIAAIVAAMLYAVITKLLDWSLSLPLVLFKGASPGKSFASSKALVSRKKKQAAATLIWWGFGVVIISLVVSGIVKLLVYSILPHFYHSLALLLPLISIAVVLWSIANFVTTALFGASFSGILSELLVRYDAPISTALFRDIQDAGRPLLTGPRILALAAVATAAAVAIGFALLDNYQAEDDLIIIAHRGAAGKAPENTMAAINLAIEDKADWVEIDVQESSDGHVVVIHDSDFMKLAQTDLKVWDGTLDQIQAIDIGSWFAPEFSSERVPLLSDVLEAAKGRANVVIELKYYGHDERLEQRVVDLVEQMEMVDSTAVMSLKYAAVQKVRALRPDWTVGLLSAKVLGKMNDLDADFLAVNTAMATPYFVRSNQQAGKKVFVWTVNDKLGMFNMMSRGVDGIITDEPALARDVIAERAELSSVQRLLVQAAIMLGKDISRKEYRDNSP